MTVPVLYFHGFASSPRGRKVDALRPLLEPQGIELHAPDLNVPSFSRLDWNAMVDLGVHEGERVAPRVIVGSSLGALLALAVARSIDAPLVLIAPALGIADRWRSQLPDGDPIVVPNYATERDEPIHRAFFEQMFAVDVDRVPPRSRVTVLMGENDETVPVERVVATWKSWESDGLAAGSRFVTIPKGDHGLTEHVEEIAEAIAESVSGLKQRGGRPFRQS